jgi:DNA-binding NtrC family response regulator
MARSVAIVVSDDLLRCALRDLIASLNIPSIDFPKIDKAAEAMRPGGLVPALVVTDGLSGAELICGLRRTVAVCTRPMILLSGNWIRLANAYPDLLAKVFPKPFDPEDLAAYIQHALNTSN